MLVAITFSLLAAGMIARGEAAGADARAYWAGGPAVAQRRRPVPPDRAVPALRLRPVDAAAVRRRGRCCHGTSPGSCGAAATILLLLWTFHWAYRRRPLTTAVIVAFLGFPLGANLDTGNINLQLTLMVWAAQFSGTAARPACCGRSRPG